MLKRLLAVVILSAVSLHLHAQRYVFYLHGAIVEGTTTTDPISDSYGRYEYTSIIKALKQYGHVVISERRPANTVAESYALKVSGQIDSLKKLGVKSDRITVIGASKGAGIAMRTSGFVKDKKVKYVLMAGCNDEDAGRYDLYGQILSIYESSDPFAGSCDAIKKRSHGVSKYKEIKLTTRPVAFYAYPMLWVHFDHQFHVRSVCVKKYYWLDEPFIYSLSREIDSNLQEIPGSMDLHISDREFERTFN